MAKNQWSVNPLTEAMQKSKRKMKNNVREFLFNSCSIVHHEYAPEGQTINKEYYLEVDFVQLWEKSDQTCGEQRIFSSTMTMLLFILPMLSNKVDFILLSH